jgi:hypothetical protein
MQAMRVCVHACVATKHDVIDHNQMQNYTRLLFLFTEQNIETSDEGKRVSVVSIHSFKSDVMIIVIIDKYSTHCALQSMIN